MLQTSHLEFVYARIDCRVELRKASVGEVKKCEWRAQVDVRGSRVFMEVKRPLEPYWGWGGDYSFDC
jgi:hypothetical protein